MNRLPIICLIFLVFAASGCVSRNMAHINNTAEAKQFFSEWPLPGEYDYYYFGRDVSPTAFLALDKKYTLESEFWTPISPTSKMREYWQGAYTTRHFSIDKEFRGKEIMSPDGKRIGIVSTRNHWVTAWFVENDPNRIVIPPPEPSPSQSRPGKANNGSNK